MTVNFAQLFAVALPPGALLPSTATGVSTTNLETQATFSSALNAAISQVTLPPAAPVVAPPIATALPNATDLLTTPTLASPLDTAVAAVIAASVTTVEPTPVTIVASTLTEFPVLPEATIAEPQTAKPIAEPAASRTEQLRFQFSAASLVTPTQVAPASTTRTKSTSSTTTILASEDQPQTDTTTSQPTSPVLPQIPLATVADSSSSQVQATALTNPQVFDRGVALPAIPPQIGYGLERPPVLAPAETTAAPPVASGNRPGVSSNLLTAAQLATEQLAPTPVPVPKGFAQVLSTATAAPVTVPSTNPVPSNPAPVALPVANAPPTPTRPVLATLTTQVPVLPNAVAPVRVETAPILPSATIVRVSTEVPTVEIKPILKEFDTATQTPLIPQTTNSANPNAPVVVDRPANASKAEQPSPPEQIAQSLVSQVRVLNKDETVEYSIRLDPPDLGRVQIRLVSTGDNLSAHVTVATDAVRQMMESQLPELRQRLEQAGVNATQIDVSTQTAGQQMGQGANGNSRWQDAQQEYPFFRLPDLPPIQRARGSPGSVGSGSRLDVTA